MSSLPLFMMDTLVPELDLKLTEKNRLKLDHRTRHGNFGHMHKEREPGHYLVIGVFERLFLFHVAAERCCGRVFLT